MTKRQPSVNAPVQGVFEFCRDELARPPKPERLFYALLPDAGTALQITQLTDRFIGENGLRGSRVKADRLHVSLHHVGDFKRLRSSTLLSAERAGDVVLLPPFEMTLHSIGSFGAKKPDGWSLALIGGGEGLTQLHGKLAEALKANGLAANDQFAPHLTLLYGAAPVAIRSIEALRFTVADFALIHSARGLGKYTVLQRWPLRS